MITVEVLPKTWNVILLNARGKITSVQNLSGNYLIEISRDVADEIVRRGGDLDNPESIHKAITSAIKGG